MASPKYDIKNIKTLQHHLHCIVSEAYIFTNKTHKRKIAKCKLVLEVIFFGYI